jgi:hypothetical protein
MIIHIGLHKTGTSWLQQVLFRPEYGFQLVNDAKEPWRDELSRFLVTGKQRQSAQQLQPSADLHQIVSSERLSGHPASGGYDREMIAHRLAEFFPDASILIGTREAAAWRKSVYAQLVREGWTGGMESDLVALWKRPGPNEAYFDVAGLLRLYRKLFDDVTELPLELLRSNPAAYLQRIAEATGNPKVIDALPEASRKVSENKLSDREIEIQRFANHFRKSPLNPNPVIQLPKGMARAIGWFRQMSPAGSSSSTEPKPRSDR